MPNKCCVPNCKGNYANGPKVNVFSFPTDEGEKSKWIRAIHRKDFIPTKHAKVCGLHFKKQEIEWITSMYDEKNGKLVTAPLSKPRLIKGAVPSQFPNCPEYLTDTATVCREDPDDRRRRIENENLSKALAESMQTLAENLETVSFSNFQELKVKLKNMSLHPEWSDIKGESCVYFILMRENPTPHLRCCIKITEGLSASLYVSNTEVKRFNGISLPKQLGTVLEIEELIKNAHSVYAGSDAYERQSVEDTISVVESLFKNLECKFPEKKDTLDFLKEQVHLLTKRKVKSYSWELLVFSSLVHSISPHCYRFIRGSGNVTLPAPRTLKLVCSKLLTNPIQEQSDNFLLYMRKKFSLISEEDKLVLLSMDEVHIKPQLDYKKGRVVGSAVNSDKCATSAYVFMVHSLLSSYKDVAHIMPVVNIRGETLLNMMKKIILGLEEFGFEVLALISDNSAINRKAVSLLSDPPELNYIYNHPKDPHRKLFFAIDTVHILKCVRNNWLNAKHQELHFPDSTEHDRLQIASFGSLKELHVLEKNNLLKYGFSLTLKSLYPTNLERQNVTLALQVFNKPLAVAIREIGPKKNLPYWDSTAQFIEFICRWWDIMNVKTLWKGKRLRNPLQEPITTNSSHIECLQKIVSWLDTWKTIVSPGKLSKETHNAITLSTKCVIAMAQYCLSEKGHSFFLPGKIQTDNLEARFGKYRQLAGSQYNISLRQVFEVENKLRLQSILDLNAAVSEYFEEDKTCDTSAFDACVADDSDVEVLQDECWPLLHYISGYCSYGFLKRYDCNYCKVFLCDEAGQSDHASLINANNRGGLCYPHADVVNCAAFAYVVMNKLLDNYKTEFLHHSNQQGVLVNVTQRCLPTVLFMGHSCPKHARAFIEKTVLGTASNILINNFVRNVNDSFSRKTLAQHKRRKLVL